jgi:hypothetical protein
MPCILDLEEFKDTVAAIETIEDCAERSDVGMLGSVLLLSARARLVKEMLDKVGACDDANAANPTKLQDCPAYQIMKERIMDRVRKRGLQSRMQDLVEAADRGDFDDDDDPNSGPDGFFI